MIFSHTRCRFVFPIRSGVVSGIWTESSCGDGRCDSMLPEDIGSFGPFGCAADCGPLGGDMLSTQSITVSLTVSASALPASLANEARRLLRDCVFDGCVCD